MTEFQSKPVHVSPPSQSILGGRDTTTTTIPNDSIDNGIHSISILDYLIRFLTFMSESYTGWREFEDDLIIYSKSTKTKQLVSSFILLLCLILTLWSFKKLKIF